MKQPELVSATPAQLDHLLVLAKASFPAPEYELLAGVITTFAFVMTQLQNAKTSLRRFRHMLFGKKTESAANVRKTIAGGKDAKAGGADDAKAGGADDAGTHAAGEPVAPASPAPEDDVGKEPEKRKGHGRNGVDAYPNAPRVKIGVPHLCCGASCPQCGVGKVYLAPPKIIVRIIGQAPLAATILELESWRCRLCDWHISAELPDGVSPSKYDFSSASMLAMLRYGSGMPHHRLDKLQASMRTPMPDATQWDIVNKAASCGPQQAYAEMIHQAAQGEIVHNDDTPARILDLMGERHAKAVVKAAANDAAVPTKKAINTTGIVSLVGDVKVVLFMTGQAHAGTNLARVLLHRAKQLRTPIQMCDALAANIKGAFLTFLALCLAHARRQFVEVAENFPEPCSHVIEVLSKIYQHDAHANDEKMSPVQRLLYHRKHSRPLMWELKKWMEKQLKERHVEPASGLGQSMRYMLKHWKGLTLFLRKAGAPLDNNIAERALKKAIIHRKNSLFYRSVRGAEVGDIFMSLIYTCEACKANPFDYLQALQQHADQVSANPQRWMPWNYEQARAAP